MKYALFSIIICALTYVIGCKQINESDSINDNNEYASRDTLFYIDDNFLNDPFDF